MRFCLSLAILACAALPASAGEKRPNVILIVADDLGWGDVGFNGRKSWATPNLDRLAREGKVFRRWYTAAVVCAPSRAAMLTGKDTIHCGVSRNDADLPSSVSGIPLRAGAAVSRSSPGTASNSTPARTRDSASCAPSENA